MHSNSNNQIHDKKAKNIIMKFYNFRLEDQSLKAFKWEKHVLYTID